MSFKIKPKLFFGTILVLSLAFAVQSFAADNLLKNYKDLYTSKQPALENWSKSSLESNGLGVLDAILPLESVPDDVLAGKLYDDQGQPIVWIPGGAIGSVNNATAALFAPSASGIEYIAHLKDNLLSKPAYAQDTGASGLMPLLPVWRGLRNAVYILSSIIFVIIGILIILRIKISPQAVITIQNAVPQIIITLVLVTFSYAIAGLLIDLSSLIQAIFASILWPDSITSLVANLPILKNFTLSAKTIVNPTGITFYGLMLFPSLVSSLLGLILGPVIGGVIGAFVGAAAGGVGALPGSIVGATLGGIIVTIVVLVIMMINLIKLLFGLIKVYVTIIFKIVVAPLEIGMGAFPGSKMGFSSWVTDLIANLAVFPIVFLFLLLVNYILYHILLTGGAFTVTQAIKGNTNLLSGLWAPGILGGNLGAFGPAGGIAVFGIGFASIAILAKLPELVPQLVFQLKNPWGQAIGQAISQQQAGASNIAKFGWNTGVDIASGGVTTGVGPFAGAYRELEGLAPGQGVPKQAGDTLRGIFRAK